MEGAGPGYHRARIGGEEARSPEILYFIEAVGEDGVARPVPSAPAAPSGSVMTPEGSSPPARDAAAPRLHHAPVSVAVAGAPMTIRANIEFPSGIRRAWLIHRLLGSIAEFGIWP